MLYCKGPGKRGLIVAHDVSWAAQPGKHLLRTQNVSEQTQKHFLCPGPWIIEQTSRFIIHARTQMLRARANGENFRNFRISNGTVFSTTDPQEIRNDQSTIFHEIRS